MKWWQKILKDWLKKLFSDFHSAIIGIIVASLIVGGGSIYLFFENLWRLLTEIAHTPTPLWETIALVLLLVLYIDLKNQKAQSLLTSLDSEKLEMVERLRALETENEYLIQKIQNIGANWTPGIL